MSGLGHRCWAAAGRRILHKMLVLILLLTVLARPATVLAARPQQESDALAAHLPLLVRDIPDPASHAAVQAYDRARLLHPQDAAGVFSQAWKGLVVPPAARKDTEALRRLLLTSQWGQTPGVKAPKVSSRALEALAQDPRNAGRLNNAAVALFMFGVSISYGAQITSVDGVPIGDTSDSYIWGVQDSALWLLKETEKVFGPSRAVTLNRAFFNSLVPSSHYPLAPAIADARRWLASDPTDRTARLLLANLQSRQADAPDAHEQAVRTLAPLLEDAATAPLGHAALGDSYLAYASLRQPEAPFLARELADHALEEYDRSLALRPDPGPHAGRAAALDLLGETQQAIAAQMEAVKLAPKSVDFLLDLASLHEKGGDARGMHGSARKALDLAMNGWNPPLSEVRLLTSRAPGGTVGFGVTAARSYLGFSVGSGAPHAGVWRTPQGGGYILVDDAVPRTNDRNVPEARRTGFTPDQAALTAISAALLLGDEQAALEAAELWFDRLDADRALAGNPTYRQTRDAAVITAYWGAYLAANPDPKEEFYTDVGEDPTTALWFAQNELRRAGKFAEAARLCRAVAEIPAKRGFSPAAVQQCLGESSYLAGDYATAAEALGRAARASEAEATRNFALLADSAVLLRVRAAAAAQAAGNQAAALELLRRAATDDSADPLTSTAAFNELGDLALDQGDPGVAGSHYDLSLTALAEAKIEPPNEDPEIVARARALAQHAHNNRGIALLRNNQPEPEVAPDCSRARRQDCVGARRDFTQALQSDPRNPVYLMNLGWAARLLGEYDAARRALSTAADADPTLFPALNDLGVLAARAGDQTSARQSFERALKAQPEYDLAQWNLGVLEMRRGLDGISPGQQRLARAISLNPDLRAESLTFKTDERVYRITFDAERRAEHQWAFGRGYSLAAAGMSALTVLTTVGQFRSSSADRVAGAVTDLGLPRLRDLGAWVVARSRPRLRGRRLHARWRVWAPWLVTVPVLLLVTVWPAWRSNPEIGVATVALAVLVTALTVLVHEVAHFAVARWARASVVPAQWHPGVALALLFLPLQLSSGPFVGQRVSGGSPSRAWWVYLSGPVANAALGVAAYGLFLLWPAPVLRLLAQVQLAAIAYALLPYEPLDGAALSEQRPAVMSILSLALGTAAAAFAFGIL